MAEVAGLVFGVLPIIIEAIKAYNSACEKITNFRNYSREVKRFWKQYELQKQIFSNDCRIFLRTGTSEADVMMQNPQHRLWADRILDQRLRALLQSSHDCCISILKDITVLLQTLKDDLRCFDILIESKVKDEPLQKAVARVRKSFKISFEKSKYEKRLDELRILNADFRVLLSQLSELQSSVCHSKACRRQLVIPAQYGAVHNAARTLIEDLTASWCCSDTSHSSHHAKLFLDATVQDTVRLDIAISYQESRDDLINSNPERSALHCPVRLHVQSSTIPFLTRSDIQIPADLGSSQCHISLDSEPNDFTLTKVIPSVSSSSSSSSKWASSSKSGKRKHIEHGENRSTSVTCETSDPELMPPRTAPKLSSRSSLPSMGCQLSSFMNLRQIGNLCRHLADNGLSPTSSMSVDAMPLGFLETPQKHKHVFYPSRSTDAEMTEIIPVSDLLQPTMLDSLDLVGQLKIAHHIVIAVLQYHSTTWLCEDWNLRRIAFFGSRPQLTDDILKTMHLSAIIPERQPQNNTTSMEDVRQANSYTYFGDLEEAQLLYGIRNLTLYNLGVALLELGRWAQTDSHDLRTVRRLAASRFPLGPKYQQVVEKCLACDFGCGSDLRKPELQDALYNDVVRPLECMMECLEIG